MPFYQPRGASHGFLRALPTRLALAILLPAALHAASVGTSPSQMEAAWNRTETQANIFEASTQGEVTVDLMPDGSSVVAWASRRQEAGSSGVFARALDPLGRPDSHEIRVNQTVAGSQSAPAVGVAEDGSVWFAWKSIGPGGDQGILARRFDAHLAALTPEIRLSGIGQRPTAPTLLAGKRGRVLVVWSERGLDTGAGLRGRWILADGRLRGDEFQITQERQVLGAPAVTRLSGGRSLVVWAEGPEGKTAPRLVARILGKRGHFVGDEFSLVQGERGGLGPIEPSVAADDHGRFVVAWLEPAGQGYRVAARRFAADGEPQGEEFLVAGPEFGWKTGASVAMAPTGEFVVSFGSEPGVGKPSVVFAQHFDAQGTPLEAKPRPLTHLSRSARAEVSGARRSAWSASGSQIFAWSGEGSSGDTKGANVTILVPREQAIAPREGEAQAAWRAAPAVASEEVAAAVPIYNPDFVPQGRDSTLGAGGDFGFVGVPGAPWTPPDPELAVGPDRIVVVTNGNISTLDKVGALQWTDEIENSFGFWGGLGANNLVFDPEVIWDPHDSRFVAMANERSDDGRSFFLLAVSKDMTPDDATDWHKYRIDVTALAANNIDSPNLAVNRDFVFLTADFFGPDRYLLFILDKTPLLSGGAVASVSELISGASQQSMGIPTVASATSDLYILQAREGAVNNDLVIHAITDPFTSYSRQTFTLPVQTYEFPIDPPQMGTSVRPELFEPRIWSVMEIGGSLWAVHHVNATRARVRWYEIALNGWPTGGTPSVAQSGELDSGSGIHTFFPSIFADAAGNAAITFARSATNEPISMGRTLRAAADPQGTFRPVQVAQTSPNGTGAFRWGDYSGTHSDPQTPGRFWGHHEFSDAGGGSWQTWIARYDLRPVPMVLSQSFQVTGATPGATVRFYATTTGTGLTTVPTMNVTLSLENAVEIEAVVADAAGGATLSVPLPPGTVLVQAAQDGLTTQWQPISDVIFTDGFESGDTSTWSQATGGA